MVDLAMSRRTLAASRILITGASSGIGRALSLELARQGARLIAVARREPQLRELAGEIKALGGAIELVVGDVTDPQLRFAAIDRSAQAYGGLDILINNAGVGARGLFEHADESRLRTVMELNLFAPAELTRLALPLLKQGVQPMVVNIGSILGHRAIPRMSEYCASKFALAGLSESLAAEFARLGIDLLLVSPGRTASEFQQHAIADQGESHWPSLPTTDVGLVARRIVRAMERGRRRLITDGNAKWLDWLNRAAPWALDRFFARRS